MEIRFNKTFYASLKGKVIQVHLHYGYIEDIPNSIKTEIKVIHVGDILIIDEDFYLGVSTEIHISCFTVALQSCDFGNVAIPWGGQPEFTKVVICFDNIHDLAKYKLRNG